MTTPSFNLTERLDKFDEKFEPKNNQFIDNPQKKLGQLGEILGRLYTDIRDKSEYLRYALWAPMGIMVGGDLIQIGGATPATPAPLKSFDQYDIPKGNYSGRFFSTARIITNLFKKYETELASITDKSGLKDLEQKLINLYNKEKELFKTISLMDELKYLLDIGEIDDKSVADLKTLVARGRKNFEEAEDERKKILSDTSKLLLPYVPMMAHMGMII